MSTKLPNISEEGAAFGSAEVAEKWKHRKAEITRATAKVDELMLDSANVQAGHRVLDVAAGTGEQTILAARRVGPTGGVLATDISASMLNLAAEAVREAGLTNVETRVMDAANLDLEEDSFDAVICRQALMFFPEPLKALIGMRRAAKPRSKVVASVFSSAERNPFQALSFAIVRRIANMPSPGAGQPGIFALGDPSVLEGVFRAAGFLDVVIQPVPMPRRFRSADEAIKPLRTNPLFLQLLPKLSDSERDKAWMEIAQEFSRFQAPNGLEIPGEYLMAVGTK
jgi:ubiquinone/menaquinone biosynthesis C-methylase UbiE